MEQEMPTNGLQRIKLSHFSLREARRFDEIDRPLQTFKGNKSLQVIYTCTLPGDALVTHFQVQLHHSELFKQLVQFIEPEASCASSRGQFQSMLNFAPPLGQYPSTLTLPAVAYTQSLRFSLLLKKDFASQFMEKLAFNREKNKLYGEENVAKMLGYLIKSIIVCGLLPNVGPSACQLTTLLNISEVFRKAGRVDQATETDLLASLSLINARRFVQASELLRKISRIFVQKYQSSKSNMEFTRIQKSWLRQDDEFSSTTRPHSAGHVLQGGRFLSRAAKIELLLAETVGHPSLIHEKLEAFGRATAYAQGNINSEKIAPHLDLEQIAYIIGPEIMPLLLRVMADKMEIMQTTALKSIEFFFQTLGCTLAPFMPQILKAVLNSYPRRSHQFGIEEIQGKSKALLDNYHHLLETLLSTIGLVNRKHLRAIFQEIVVANIAAPYLRSELRLYLLRFGEKILTLCGPDLVFDVGFLVSILALAEGKSEQAVRLQTNKVALNEQANKHIQHNLVYFSQKTLELLKAKFIGKNQQLLPTICDWLHDTLVAQCENESLVANCFLLGQLLDFCNIIYQGKFTVKVACPIQPVVYFLNMSLMQPRLPYEKILQTLVVLLQYLQLNYGQAELPGEIIDRIMRKSKLGSLNVKELKVLQKVLACVEESTEQWLSSFLDCVPHSNFDETYSVLDTLLRKGTRHFEKPLLLRIVCTFLDQYTVKGKAHQQSKENFLQILLTSSNNRPLGFFVALCLFDNPCPNPVKYYARKPRPNEHVFDSKMYRVEQELFAQKLSLLSLFFSKLEVNPTPLLDIFDSGFIYQLHDSLKLLLTVPNFKLKSRALVLMKHLIILISELKNLPLLLLFAKAMLHLLRSFLALQRDSKLHYYSLLNLGLILDIILKIDTSRNSPDCSLKIDFMETAISDEQSLKALAAQSNLEVTSELRLHELSKIWQFLIGLFASPWESVRQMLIRILLHFFSYDIAHYAESLRDKVVELVRPLLCTMLISDDHIERLAAVRILACLAGFGRKYSSREEITAVLRVTSKWIRPFMELVYSLQNDWEESVALMSKLLFSLCLTQQARQNIVSKLTMEKRWQNNSFESFSLDENRLDRKSSFLSTPQHFELILKDFDGTVEHELGLIDEQAEANLALFRLSLQNNYFVDLQNVGEKDSLVEEQHFFQPNEERQSEDAEQGSEQQQLQFQDLGIIQLDDQEWGEEENEMRITQKLPLKKIYKLSPNIGNSNKRQRIHSKRFHQKDYQPHQNIIVDEIQANPNIPKLQQTPRLVGKPKVDQLQVESVITENKTMISASKSCKTPISEVASQEAYFMPTKEECNPSRGKKEKKAKKRKPSVIK